jgi:hypothetical protein
MAHRVLCCLVWVILLLATPVPAAETKPVLKAGADLPGPFRPYNVVNGKFEGKFHCLVCEHALKPGVLLFVKDPRLTNAADPLPALLEQLDKYITANLKSRLGAFAVFTYPDVPDAVTSDDAREARAQSLRPLKPRLQQVVLAIDSQQSLAKAGYDLDPQAAATVILYDKMKILNVYILKSDDEIKEKLGAILTEVQQKLAPMVK